MSQMPRIQYFLGANAPSGFYSLYSELLPADQARRIYILKGGPGCGKSTLMKWIRERAEASGLRTETILCSGDPASLDALLLPELDAALVDGTAPHVVEPKCPGAVERYVDLGACYDAEGLFPLRESLMAEMSGYRACYQRAYRCLGAAAELMEELRGTLMTEQLAARLAKRARGILAREVGKKRGSGSGAVRQRFLGAVTCQGTVCLFETAQLQCRKRYALADRWGLGHALLLQLLAGATEAGFDVVACPDPMAPERLAHLLIPELGVAFLTENDAAPYPGRPERRLRLDAAAMGELQRSGRPRLRFAQRVYEALMEEAVGHLSQAKAMHDELEAHYNPYVDFEQVRQIALRIGDELLG